MTAINQHGLNGNDVFKREVIGRGPLAMITEKMDERVSTTVSLAINRIVGVVIIEEKVDLRPNCLHSFGDYLSPRILNSSNIVPLGILKCLGVVQHSIMLGF